MFTIRNKLETASFYFIHKNAWGHLWNQSIFLLQYLKTLKLSSHLGQEAVYLLWRLYLALLKQWNIAKCNIQHYCYHKIVHKNITQNPHINKRSFLAILVFNAIISSIIKQRLRKFTHIYTTPILWPLEPSNLCHFSKLIWQWITICHVCFSTFMWWYTHF